MNWKAALFDYIRCKNRMEAGSPPEETEVRALDDEFAHTLGEWFRQLELRNRERGIRPKKQETRLRFGPVEEGNDSVTAVIGLYRESQFELCHIAHSEKRMEWEKVRLVRTRAGWKVRSSEPCSREKQSNRPDPLPLVYGGEWDDRTESSPSVPYLNPILYSSGPAASIRTIAYDRAKARAYADQWWNSANPKYIHFEVDCSSYVSQCVHAGEIPMNYTGCRESGWWYHGRKQGREWWSYSWAVAHSLQRYLSTSRTGLRAQVVDSPGELQIGDVISYDWDGTGRYGHSTVVTAKAADGLPLVNAHTVNSYHRYWDYRDSYAWTPKTRYCFLHIPDLM
jgi:hypothetical protein